MDATRSRPRDSLADLSPQIRRLLQADFDKDDPDIPAVWNRWHQTKRRKDFHRLFEHYSPIVLMMGRQLKRRAPGTFKCELSEILPDGLIALTKFIQKTRPREGYYAAVIVVAIRRGMYRGNDVRESSPGRAVAKRQVRSVRRQLTHQLGREPSDREVASALVAKLKQPQQCLAILRAGNSADPKLFPVSQLESADDGWNPTHAVTQTREPDPVRQSQLRDFTTVAFSGLPKRDRFLLRSIMQDRTGPAIARKLGVSRERVRQLQNKLLWQLRCNRRLAAAAGVKPDDDFPPPGPNRQPPNFPSSPAPSPIAA
jgi:DNA-directed RNA polymerase specialized sigma subunit